MPARLIPLNAVEPDVFLSRWRVFETDDGLKRLVGYDSVDRGCVSSALISFDRQGMYAEASDGITYRLVSKPGWFWDVVEVWDIWVGGGARDVTDDFYCVRS